MATKALHHGKAGVETILIALIVLAVAMVVIGVALWMHMGPQGSPTKPNEPHSQLRIELQVSSRALRV